MKIHLLYFEGCPNVDASRTAILEALAAEKLEARVEEIDVGKPGAPEWVHGWGSPTILIDGDDVAGQKPSTSSACRLYTDGAPSVASIRERLVAACAVEPEVRRRVALPMIGAVTAAIAASACCLVPAILAVVGVSGAGFGAAFAPYRLCFLIATGVALAAGFWFAYRPQKDACGCESDLAPQGDRHGLRRVHEHHREPDQEGSRCRVGDRRLRVRPRRRSP